MLHDHLALRPHTTFQASDAIGCIDEIDTLASIGTPSRRTDSRSYARGEGIFVRGWIAAPGRREQPRAVGLVIDDAYELSALCGTPRADVAAALGDARYGEAGFLGTIVTDLLATGPHRVRAFALDDASSIRFDLLAEGEFDIREPHRLFSEIPIDATADLRGNVDAIRVDLLPGHAGIADAASVYVRGWACDMRAHEPVAEVFGSASTGSTSRAVVGFARPDVALALGDAALENCGFRMRIFVRSEAFEATDLAVTALSADRSRRGEFWNGRVG
jgi:hypothetical protein